MIAMVEPGYLPGLRRLRGRVAVTAIASRTRAPDRTRVLARASLVEHLADCLDNGARPLPSAARARHVLEIMLAAQTAAATGQTIRLATSFEH
jgi:predicted dehydrogenase